MTANLTAKPTDKDGLFWTFRNHTPPHAARRTLADDLGDSLTFC
jgi:hypothetical protein